MHERRDPSFLPKKKNPAPAGEEKGLIISAARDSVMYWFIASRSLSDSKYRRPLCGVVAGSRSMAQSYGGKEMPRHLLKAFLEVMVF